MSLSSAILASLLISFVITATNPIISPVPASINAATLNIATGKRIADVVEIRPTSLSSVDPKKITSSLNDQKDEFTSLKSANKEYIFQRVNMNPYQDPDMDVSVKDHCPDEMLSFNIPRELDPIGMLLKAAQESDLQNNANSSDTILLRPKRYRKRIPS